MKKILFFAMVLLFAKPLIAVNSYLWLSEDGEYNDQTTVYNSYMVIKSCDIADAAADIALDYNND